MMKEQNFDWLLCGCHALSEVAVAYFPEIQYTNSASRTFRRVIKERPLLLDELTKVGFTPHTTMLTPLQLAAVVRFWGMPNEVNSMIEKDPYLAVPKMVQKI